MNRFLQIPIAIAICLSLGACSSNTAVTQTSSPAQTGSVTKRLLPITMIEQELPIPTANAWEIVNVALQQQNIPLAEVVESELLMVTEWIPMRDRICTTATSGRTPLPCETQYRLALYPRSAQATLLRIRYTEDCTGEHQIFLTCPNSTAETRMIEIVGDIKALAGLSN